jgi:DNA (cytosine-5)-methyltransferase 1
LKTIVPIIDIFAGPGGLGEGFSQLRDKKIQFKIALSVEKDKLAHRTLELRAFYRQFKKAPDTYFDYLNGKIDREELFSRHPVEAESAQDEAWHHEITEEGILDVINRAKKSLEKFNTKEFVMIGGPPCQAYSMAGRSRMKSTNKNFDDDPRHFLYRHYLRMVAKLTPAIFVMENVKGLTSATIDGQLIFPQILEELRRPGTIVKDLDGLARAPSRAEYNIYSLVTVEPSEKEVKENAVHSLSPNDYVIKSEEYGIPQRRHRIILLGVRQDIDPCLAERLVKVAGELVAADVLNDLPAVRSGITGYGDATWQGWVSAMRRGLEKGEFDNVDKKTIDRIRQVINSQVTPLSVGAERYSASLNKTEALKSWYRNDCSRLEKVLNHLSKNHMLSDIWRYLFCVCFADVHHRTPKLSDFPDNLLPNHSNVNANNKKTAKFIDRFKVQISSRASTTVMSHISKDGHYYIHHDPMQCRAWTVREAARIQTFPDNYYFEGGKTAAYHQVGNAVPPRLAWKIAKVVAEHLKAIAV